MANAYLGTYSGKAIDVLNPHPDDIDIVDIARGLSNLCRFGGQVKRFYSVAEHSILVSKKVPTKMALQALMHDAPEAYLVDLPTPIKRNLPLYYEIEAKLHLVIAAKFGFDPAMPQEIKTADARMCATETHALQNHTAAVGKVWGDFFVQFPPYPDVTISPLEQYHTSPRIIRRRFREEFEWLTSR